LIRDASLLHLDVLSHLQAGKAYVCRTGKAESDSLSDALTALRLGLGCLPFERCNLRALRVSLDLVGLSDALLFGLLKASKGLLCGLLLQEDVTARDCPAPCLLRCCLLQGHSLDVTGNAHLSALGLPAQTRLFGLGEPEVASALPSAELVKLSLLLGGELQGSGGPGCADALGNASDGFGSSDADEAEGDGVHDASEVEGFNGNAPVDYGDAVNLGMGSKAEGSATVDGAVNEHAVTALVGA
jgi:hypothetical protein